MERTTLTEDASLISSLPPQHTNYSPILSTHTTTNNKNKKNENEKKIENINGTTPLQTCFAIFKGNVGPGCLSLPWAFSILGIPLGCITTVIVTFLVSYNAWTLVRLKRSYLDGRRGVTYSDVGERAYGSKFRIVVDLSVILLQLAVCTVFFSNMAENTSTMIRLSFHHDDSNTWWHFLQQERVIMTLFLLPSCMLLSSLPNLKVLAPSIALASVLMCTSLLFIFYIIYHDWSDGYEQWKASGGISVQWDKVPLATCAIMYSLEGDQLILPIEAAMTHPYRHFTRTFVASMAGICVLFCVFASTCVIAFGYVDDGSITAFLLSHTKEQMAASTIGLDGTTEEGIGNNAGGWGSTWHIAFLANAIVSVSLLFTYPLQLFPALGLVGQIIARRQEERNKVQVNYDHGDVCSKNTSFQSLRQDADDDDDDAMDRLSDSEKHEEKINANENDLESNDGGIEIVSLHQHHKDNDDNIKKNQHQQHQQDDEIITTNKHPKQITEEDFFQEGLDIEGDSLTMRFTLVFFTYLSAMIVPQLRLLIALGGAITGSMTSLIVPPLLALRFVFSGGSKKDWGWSAWYVSLMSIGLVYAYIGTAASIEDIVEVYGGK